MAYTRFRRSIGLGAGVRFNVNKRSLGLSFGVPGARLSLNTDGRRTASIGVPGSGLYFVDSKKLGERKGPSRPRQTSASPDKSTVHWLQPGDADALIPKAGFLASEPERRFRDGVVAYVRGDWDAATAAFERAVEIDAANVSDEFFLGATYFIRGLDAAAVGPLEHVVASVQDLPDDLMHKFVPGPIQLRVAVTNRVTALAPFSSLGAALMLAEVYQRLGRLEEAIGLVQRLSEVAPDEPMLTLSLADLYFEDGDLDAVVSVARHLRGPDPASLDAQRLVQIARSAGTSPAPAKTGAPKPDRLEQLAQRVESIPAPPEVKPRSVRVSDSVGTAPQDTLTGLPLPGPEYPVSWAWKPGESSLHLDRASSRLSAPLAADMAFIFVDMLGVHRLAERLSWGYGNAIIVEIAARLHEYRSDDIVFRTGADAFLVCVPDTTPDDLPGRLDDIRRLATEPVSYPDASTFVDLRCTVGAAVSRGGESAEDMFLRGLAQLEEAQANGVPQSMENAS